MINYYDENAAKVRIPLDKALTPAQNAQAYYKRYNKQKRTLAAVAPQKAEAEADLDYTASMLSALSRSENMLDLTELEEELRGAGLLPPEKKRGKNTPDVPFRTFMFGEISRICGAQQRAERPPAARRRAGRYLAAHAEVPQRARAHPHGRAEGARRSAARRSTNLRLFFGRKGGRQNTRRYCERRFVKKPPRAKAGFVTYTDFKTVLVTPDRHEKEEG